MISNGSSICESRIPYARSMQSHYKEDVNILPVIKTKPTLKSFDLIRYAKSHQRMNAYGAYFQLDFATGILVLTHTLRSRQSITINFILCCRRRRRRWGEKEYLCDSFLSTLCANE